MATTAPPHATGIADEDLIVEVVVTSGQGCVVSAETPGELVAAAATRADLRDGA